MTVKCNFTRVRLDHRESSVTHCCPHCGQSLPPVCVLWSQRYWTGAPSVGQSPGQREDAEAGILGLAHTTPPASATSKTETLLRNYVKLTIQIRKMLYFKIKS